MHMANYLLHSLTDATVTRLASWLEPWKILTPKVGPRVYRDRRARAGDVRSAPELIPPLCFGWVSRRSQRFKNHFENEFVKQIFSRPYFRWDTLLQLNSDLGWVKQTQWVKACVGPDGALFCRWWGCVGNFLHNSEVWTVKKSPASKVCPNDVNNRRPFSDSTAIADRSTRPHQFSYPSTNL